MWPSQHTYLIELLCLFWSGIMSVMLSLQNTNFNTFHAILWPHWSCGILFRMLVENIHGRVLTCTTEWVPQFCEGVKVSISYCRSVFPSYPARLWTTTDSSGTLPTRHIGIKYSNLFPMRSSMTRHVQAGLWGAGHHSCVLLHHWQCHRSNWQHSQFNLIPLPWRIQA